MTEVKFRAIAIDTGKWVYGYYVKQEEVTLAAIWENKESRQKAALENTKHYIIWDGFSDWNMEKPHYQVEVDGRTVSQYTGLKINGVEVYKSDIMVGVDKKPMIVEWLFNRWIWRVNGRRQEFNRLDFEAGFFKVIGNICENPELVEHS